MGRRRSLLPLSPAAALAAALIPAIGCAKNPVTGHRQMMLLTEEQEFAIGQGADVQVRRESGVYLDSPDLRAYVDRIGNALAERGERPGMVFHFEVLDSPEINAFALPGGFVYVTRGILERLSSEDQLAMVLGHEVAHVTARHGAARLSRLYALQYGSLVGAIVSPRTLVHYGDLIDLALQVALSKYSRDQESEADRLGLAYAGALGYRRGEAATVLEILKWLEGREPRALERWFLSHPPAAERRADLDAAMAAGGQEAAAPIRREAYLRRIEGLRVGQGNGSEMVVRGRYYNKELGVSLGVPHGWEVALEPEGSVMSMSRGEAEYLTLESAPMNLPIDAAGVEAAFERSLKRRGWRRTGGEGAETAQGVSVRLASYRGATSRGEPVGVLCLFAAQGKRRWTLTRLAARDAFEAERDRHREAALDLRFLDAAELAALAPPRLRLEAAGAGATWASLAAEHLADPQEGERLAFYNGLDPDRPPEEGTLLKIPPTLTLRP